MWFCCCGIPAIAAASLSGFVSFKRFELRACTTQFCPAERAWQVPLGVPLASVMLRADCLVKLHKSAALRALNPFTGGRASSK